MPILIDYHNIKQIKYTLSSHGWILNYARAFYFMCNTIHWNIKKIYIILYLWREECVLRKVNFSMKCIMKADGGGRCGGGGIAEESFTVLDPGALPPPPQLPLYFRSISIRVRYIHSLGPSLKGLPVDSPAFTEVVRPLYVPSFVK